MLRKLMAIDTHYIDELFGDKKNELIVAVRTASAQYDFLVGHFFNTQDQSSYGQSSDSKKRVEQQKSFMYDLLKAYVHGTPDRERQIALFAEGAQMPLNDIKSLLDYLGLPLNVSKSKFQLIF